MSTPILLAALLVWLWTCYEVELNPLAWAAGCLVLASCAGS